MKDILVFMKSGETMTLQDVYDVDAEALEKHFYNDDEAVIKLSDSTGKALFRLNQVAGIIINEPPESKRVCIQP